MDCRFTSYQNNGTIYGCRVSVSGVKIASYLHEQFTVWSPVTSIGLFKT